MNKEHHDGKNDSQEMNHSEKELYVPGYFHRYCFGKPMNFKIYEPCIKCKSAGIIPYTLLDGNIYFLLQKANHPNKYKDNGWDDFGGKQLFAEESPIHTAAREFSEETSCLFFLKELYGNNQEYRDKYMLLKNNGTLHNSHEINSVIIDLIPKSTEFYVKKISSSPLYISSKEIYISYLVKVPYVPDTDLPIAEDMHINYDIRYLRKCRWFSISDITTIDQKYLHKRLQIMKPQYRIKAYYDKNKFT